MLGQLGSFHARCSTDKLDFLAIHCVAGDLPVPSPSSTRALIALSHWPLIIQVDVESTFTHMLTECASSDVEQSFLLLALQA